MYESSSQWNLSPDAQAIATSLVGSETTPRAAAYREVVAGLLTWLQIEVGEGASEEAGASMARLLRDRGIMRILDLGCGEGGLLRVLARPAEIAGIELVGLDRRPRMSWPGLMEEFPQLDLRAGDMSNLAQGERFDLVLSCGTLTLLGACSVLQPPIHRATLLIDMDLMHQTLDDIHQTAAAATLALSDHPRSAFLANTFESALLLSKFRVEKTSAVLVWDTRRLGSYGKALARHGSYLQHHAAKILANVWKEAPSFALLTRSEG